LAFKHEGEDENFSGPRWSIVQVGTTTRWSCCDQSPSGRLLVVEHADYLPEFKVRVHVYLRVKSKISSLMMETSAKLAPQYCGLFQVLERVGLV
jgi:hypothetical protein